MKVSERLLAWQVLQSLSEGKGFSLAADRFGRDEAFYCRLTHGLENELNIKLTEPHSRPVRLTHEAVELLPEIRSYLEAAEKLRKKVSRAGCQKLYIKLGIPINVPRTSFMEIIQSYTQKDSNLQVEILSDVDHEDVLSGKVDIAYLPYRPSSEGLFVWKVNRVGNYPLATPEYLQKRGIPHNPWDLKSHNIILRTGRNYPVTTYLQKNGERQPLEYEQIVFSGDVLSGKEWLMAGMGIAIDLSLAFCWKDIERGRLLPVLNGWTREPWELTMVIRREDLSNQRLVALSRALVDHEISASVNRAQFYAEGIQKLWKNKLGFSVDY